VNKTMMTHLGGPIADGVKDTSPKPLFNRREGRLLGNFMGTTRKRDLRVQWGHRLGTEARLTFGPRSSNPKTRKVAKRRERHYAKYGMIFKENRDS